MRGQVPCKSLRKILLHHLLCHRSPSMDVIPLSTLPSLLLVHFSSFTRSFHHTECPDEEGMLPPILDTGATHCLLPLRWMTHEQAERCKKIHLKVASGSSVRALLYNNTRPLISVGQLKSMLDLRVVWDDSAPLVIACPGGLRCILAEASIFRNLPVIAPLEMNAFLEAIHCFTENGRRWNALTWSQKLGRKLRLSKFYHRITPNLLRIRK